MNEEFYIYTVAVFTNTPKQSVIKFKDLERKTASEGRAKTLLLLLKGRR